MAHRLRLCFECLEMVTMPCASLLPPIKVFCDEPMDFLRKWSCDDLTIYAYSKCGMISAPGPGAPASMRGAFQGEDLNFFSSQTACTPA